MKNGSKVAIVVGIIVLILCICCACFGLYSLFSLGSLGELSVNNDVIKSGNINEEIAVIDIKGAITSTPASTLFESSDKDMTTIIIEKLDRAINSKNVKAIILDINSPGGEVYASELIANKVKEAKEAGKKVVALMEDMAASGGYYVAAPADKIVASESTITGSIGVYFQFQSMEGLYEKLGIKTYTIVNKEGKYKVIDDSVSDKNDEHYKVLEEVVNDTYDQFIEVVSEGRKMSLDQVRTLADGRIYSGIDAKSVGLVDELGYMEEAIEIAKKEANLSNPRVVRYSEKSSYLSNLNTQLGKALNNLSGGEAHNIKGMYMIQY